MAVIKQGILGGFSGKVGGIVGTSWKGIGVMKAMPLSVANPKTSGQVNNRNRNTGVLRFAQEVGTTFIRTYWNRFAKGMSGFNDFMSVNYASFNGATGLYDDSKMFTSVGKLQQMNVTSATGNHSANLVANFSARSAAADYVVGDLVDTHFFNIDKGVGVTEMGTAAAAVSVTVTCPDGWLASEQVDAFVSCRRADGTAVSTSAMATCILT